jgi:hypothetical protein
MGDYPLTADDVLTARKFGDVIAWGTYPIDIQNAPDAAPCCSPSHTGRRLRTPCAAS